VNMNAISTDVARDVAPVVFVVDDDAYVREAVAGLLATVGVKVRLFASAIELLLQLESPQKSGLDRPSCLIVDVRMPGLGGLELQQRLLRASMKLSIIFMSGHGDVAMTVQAMKAGARDFLPKPFRDQDMLDSLSSALVHDHALREAENLQRELRKRYESLTSREQTVMALVSSGLMNKQIAAEMALSEITVKVHRGLVMRKMKAKSLAELVKIEARVNENL
jgi:FixJ family two-component response regulator